MLADASRFAPRRGKSPYGEQTNPPLPA